MPIRDDDDDRPRARKRKRYEDEDDFDQDDYAPKKKKKKKKEGSNKALTLSLIGGAALLVIGGMVLIIVLSSSGGGGDKKGGAGLKDGGATDAATKDGKPGGGSGVSLATFQRLSLKTTETEVVSLLGPKTRARQADLAEVLYDDRAKAEFVEHVDDRPTVGFDQYLWVAGKSAMMVQIRAGVIEEAFFYERTGGPGVYTLNLLVKEGRFTYHYPIKK